MNRTKFHNHFEFIKSREKRLLFCIDKEKHFDYKKSASEAVKLIHTAFNFSLQFICIRAINILVSMSDVVVSYNIVFFPSDK